MLDFRFLNETLDRLSTENQQYSVLFDQWKPNIREDYQKMISSPFDTGKIDRNPFPFFCAVPAPYDHSSPSILKDYSIASVDGSQMLSMDLGIDVSPFFLVNIGFIHTDYPQKKVVEFSATPSLVSQENLRLEYSKEPTDLFRNLTHYVPIFRTRFEFDKASQTIDNLNATDLILIDGGLLQWHLADKADPIALQVLTEVSQVLDKAESRHVHLLGYISGSMGSDVVGTLRSMHCSESRIDCAVCPDPYCYTAKRLDDGALFQDILTDPGKQDWTLSPLFKSTAPMIREFYGQDIYFFYLYNDQEFVRIECTDVSTQNLQFVVGVLLDQIQKGFGYPVVLQEAHELAVLTASDRLLVENYWLSKYSREKSKSNLRLKNIAKKVKYI